MFALRRAAVRAIATPRPAVVRPFSVLGARLCKNFFHEATRLIMAMMELGYNMQSYPFHADHPAFF
jgi:hypothetical protein